jgi:hypothetical protein
MKAGMAQMAGRGRAKNSLYRVTKGEYRRYSGCGRREALEMLISETELS